MKKLLLAIASILLVAPVAANAAALSYVPSQGDIKVTCNTEYLVAGGSRVCTLAINIREGIDVAQFAIAPTAASTKITIDNVVAAGNWQPVSITPNGRTTEVSLKAASAQGPGLVNFISFKMSATADFDVEKDSCDYIIIWNKQTIPVPVPPKPVNPETGSFVPFAIIGTGAVLAAGIYVFATNKNKFYKI